MPSPMGRVAPKGSGEVQQTLPSIEILSANPYCGRTSSAPAASRWGTFPKGEGFRSRVFILILLLSPGQSSNLLGRVMTLPY